MSHSHDQTLISRLGFSDPDKKLPRHDMACRYVARPEVLQRLLQAPADAKYSPQLEVVISKGEGKYRQHVGFVDVMANVVHSFGVVEVPASRVEKAYSYKTQTMVMVLAEVKIQPVLASEIIRQLNLYRQYVNLGSYGSKWETLKLFAVVDFDLTESDRQALLSAQIKPVRLGPDFETWLGQQDVKADLESI
jgi:hypothetical protein